MVIGGVIGIAVGLYLSDRYSTTDLITGWFGKLRKSVG